MAADRQLSEHFWLREFPCYEHASEADVVRLRETVARVLQPIRNRWGRVIPTSWMHWRDGCEPRTGAHAGGGTVDFVTADADLREVFEWGRTALLPTGYVGRWIYEPDRSPAEGQPQDEHIHVAPLADMIAHSGASDRDAIKALEETEEGQYVLRSSMVRRADLVEPLAAGKTGWLWLLLFVGLTFNLAGQAAPRAP